MSKYVYAFGNGKADGDGSKKELLGGKGANLAEMTAIGLPVPPGFTLTTEVCKAYYANEKGYPTGLREEVAKALKTLEKQMGKGFGDSQNPLLVSVRSGARASMPGMMDTVLNLGLNDQTIQGVINQSNDPRFAYDSYRRFIQMYANVVKGMNGEAFARILAQKKDDRKVELDTDLTSIDLLQLVGEFKLCYQENLGEVFPEDPMEQLWEAIGAVFGSWMTPRAVTYRKLHGIPSAWGTAVSVQGMVFG
ncbi:MAG: pyruvate, phosphate dikinase, partial [Desulfuromonadales bacterium]|nr:pyruvate, phosphate dikinase [Desulfuromonadales bacterium]